MGKSKESHFLRRSGLFEYKAVIGEDKFGFEERKSFYSRKSLLDAKSKARRFLEDQAVLHASGGPPKQRSVPLQAMAKRWLTVYKKGHVKDNTYTGTYEIPVEKHLIPHFENMDISEIRHTDIQKFLNEVSLSYAAESVKKMFACLTTSPMTMNEEVDISPQKLPNLHLACSPQGHALPV